MGLAEPRCFSGTYRAYRRKVRYADENAGTALEIFMDQWPCGLPVMRQVLPIKKAAWRPLCVYSLL